MGQRRDEPAAPPPDAGASEDEDTDPGTEVHATVAEPDASSGNTEDWAPPFHQGGEQPQSGEWEAVGSAADELEERLREAESRAAAAEARADRLTREREDAEERIGALSEQLRRARETGAAAGPGTDGGARVAPDNTPEEQIARIDADAEERIRTEVGVARKAAEERFGETLAARERDLEHEREHKVRLIEESERRLSEIEHEAAAAGERVTQAERALSDEAERLRSDAEARIEAEAERARDEAATAADARVQARELELEESIERSERAEHGANERVAVAEQRAEAAEAAAADVSQESRLAAASWVRAQAKALRQEGERGSEEERQRLRTELAAAHGRIEELGGGTEPTGPHEPEPARAEPERENPRIDDRVSLISADFEQLRTAGLSPAQAGRVLRYRDERGLNSVAGLAEVPGFPRSFLESLSTKLRD